MKHLNICKGVSESSDVAGGPKDPPSGTNRVKKKLKKYWSDADPTYYPIGFLTYQL